MHTIADKKLLMLKPEEIKTSRNQPRKVFDEYDLKHLAESIASSGIIQPLSVRKSDDGRYELIAGERRLRAAIMAGMRRVPCVLHKADDTTAALYALMENLQRSNLSFFEEAEALEKLIMKYGMSQSEVAARLGIAQSTLSNKLRILRLDEDVRQRIYDSGLTERHARALLRLSAEKRQTALDKIIADEMNLAQTEALVKSMLEEALPTPPLPIPAEEEKNEKPLRRAAIGDVRLFSNSLSKLVDTLQSAGINAYSKKYETEKYVEYKVRIKKEAPKSADQMKIIV